MSNSRNTPERSACALRPTATGAAVDAERCATMAVVTATVMRGTPEVVWPLLCDSRMDSRVPCAFRLGIPKPVECRLPDGNGGVGERRQCVSDRGVINQRITHWENPTYLRFQMEDSSLYFRSCVTSIVDEFRLAGRPDRTTEIARTTTIQVTGFARRLKALVVCIGLKCVHRYVFRNWARLAAGPVDPAEGPRGRPENDRVR